MIISFIKQILKLSPPSKIFNLFLFGFILLSLGNLATAQPGQPNTTNPSAQSASPGTTIQTITLRDGTILKGKLIEVANNQYIFETSYFGQVSLKIPDVIGITSENYFPTITSQNLQPPQGQTMQSQWGNNPQSSSQTANASQGQAPFNQQISEMQQQMMSDPQIVAQLKELAEDPSILEVLNDPDFIAAVMNKDIEKVKNNPKAQALLNNPKIISIIKQMGGGQQNSDSPH